MMFIDITCMCDRSEVIIETFPRRNDTPFFTTRSCRLNGGSATMVCFMTISLVIQQNKPKLVNITFILFDPAISIHCINYNIYHTCVQTAWEGSKKSQELGEEISSYNEEVSWTSKKKGS